MAWGSKAKVKKDRQPKAHFKYRCTKCAFVAIAVKEKDIEDGEPCWQSGCTGKMKKIDNKGEK